MAVAQRKASFPHPPRTRNVPSMIFFTFFFFWGGGQLTRRIRARAAPLPRGNCCSLLKREALTYIRSNKGSFHYCGI